MTSKEILDKNAKEILTRILLGESLSKLQKEYGVDQSTIADYYRAIFEKDERALKTFNDVLGEKKRKTSSKELDKEKFEKCVKEYLKGIITQEQAAKELQIHQQTFKSKMIFYINEDEELIRLYEERINAQSDYSDIDFEELILEMLEQKKKQKDIEEQYGLKAKTLSKKIAKIKQDTELYMACKLLAGAMCGRHQLTDNETDYINQVVKERKQKREEIVK